MGGDKNGKLDYPITAITFSIGQPVNNGKPLPVESALSFDSLTVDSDKSPDETLGSQVSVSAPAYGADVKGDTTVSIAARGRPFGS